MMNRSAMKNFAKISTLLSVTVAALQIPLLMLWVIAVNTLRTCSCGLTVTEDPAGDLVYTLTFQWEKFWEVFPSFLPIFLALTACFVLSVVGLISVLRKKRVTVPTICFYGVTVLACGFLCFAFARPATILGGAGYSMTTIELTFFRYFGVMKLEFDISLFFLLRLIKFILLGLLMAGSGALCGWGIVERVRRDRTPPAAETESVEPELHPIQGRRETD